MKVGASAMSLRRPKLLALCGIAAPPFFALMVIVESLLRPGYSQVSNVISDLGVGEHAILQDINFWVFGILVFLLALGLSSALPRSRAVFATMSVFAWSVFVAGFFPDSPYPYPGNVHNAAAIIAFLSIITSQFLMWRRLHSSTGEERTVWGRYGTYSLLSGISSSIFFLAFGNAPASPIAGLTQRLLIVVIWSWIEVVAVRLYQSTKSKSVSIVKLTA